MHNVREALTQAWGYFRTLLVKRPDVIYISIARGFWGFLRDAVFLVPAKMLGVRSVIHLRAGHFDLRTAVFGGGAQASQLISYLNKNDELAVEVVGRFNDLPQAGEEESDLLPSRGDLSALIRLIRAGRR